MQTNIKHNQDKHNCEYLCIGYIISVPILVWLYLILALEALRDLLWACETSSSLRRISY